MIAIILAAGVGSRLGKTHPKSLTPLERGITIMEWQISHLKKLGFSRILAMVGFKKELIMEQFPDILYGYNPAYLLENTSKSLLRALTLVDEDVLWLNGDVIFHPKIIKTLTDQKCPSMLVNKTDVGEEEVKYSLAKDGSIAEVSKNVKNPEGESIGINFFPQKSLKILKDNLHACALNDYFEHGIELSINQGLKVYPTVCDLKECIEIDFPEDLAKANSLISTWEV